MSEDALAETTASALRPSGLQALELSVGTEISIALYSSNKLHKIAHIIEAFWLLPAEKRKEIIENEKEIERLRRIHTVALAFADMQTLPPRPYDYNLYALIPLPFAKESANDFFQEFLVTIYSPEDMSEKDWDMLTKKIQEDPETMKGYFTWLAGRLSSGYYLGTILEVKGQFMDWALPLVVELAHKIVVRFISRETWEQALALTMGKGAKRGSSSEADPTI